MWEFVDNCENAQILWFFLYKEDSRNSKFVQNVFKMRIPKIASFCRLFSSAFPIENYWISWTTQDWLSVWLLKPESSCQRMPPSHPTKFERYTEKNISLECKHLFWIPNLDVFQLFHCKTCHNSWQPVLKPNICAELSSQNRRSYFEIGNVNKPLKYWCRKTVVMSQIQIECKIIHWALWIK